MYALDAEYQAVEYQAVKKYYLVPINKQNLLGI